MSEKDRQVKSIVLLEGHVRWIMDRETPEERLAAWETLAAIAFPENPYELPYKPPSKPLDGSRMNPCDRVRRDTYNMLADYIYSRLGEKECSGNDNVNEQAGTMDGSLGDSSSSTTDDEYEFVGFKEDRTMDKNSFLSKFDMPSKSYVTMTPLDRTAEETVCFSERYRKIEPRLTEQDKKKIEEWHKRIPNAAALREWLDRNWFFQNKNLVCSKRFCEYAYMKLAREDNWVSYKTNHAIGNIRTAIHWLAIDFYRKENEIKRVDEEEKRKNTESEFETKAKIASQMTNEEIADIQRISSRKAEREAMEKIIRGEL